MSSINQTFHTTDDARVHTLATTPTHEKSVPLVFASRQQITSSFKGLVSTDPRYRASGVISLISPLETFAFLTNVDDVFCDLDDTLLLSGTNELGTEVCDEIRALNNREKTVYFVTGKPLEEIQRVINSVPPDLKIKIMLEKGAYYIETGPGASREPVLLLTTQRIVEGIAKLRHDFFSELVPKLQTKYPIEIGFAGMGTHRSILSIDIYKPGLPGNYLQLTGKERDELKIPGEELRTKIFDEICGWYRRWAHAYGAPEFANPVAIDLNNANFEFTAHEIEKDIAIATARRKTGNRVAAYLGDSRNDAKAFALSTTDPSIRACLVCNAATPLDELLPFATLIVPGRATGVLFLRLINQVQMAAAGVHGGYLTP